MHIIMYRLLEEWRRIGSP